MLAYHDLYNVLGLSRSATTEEIKRAYRDAARKYHPDRTGGDEAAAQRFQDVKAAYEVLSDPEERTRYDRMGPFYTPDGRPMRPDELNETVAGIVGRIFRRKQSSQGETLKYTLQLDLESVGSGCKRPIEYLRRVRCGTCGGNGARPGDGTARCSVCSGTGRSQGRVLRSACYHCSGTGFTIVHPCETCTGSGRQDRLQQLEVTVPPGVATGQTLRLAGCGDASPNEGEDGDLLVQIQIAHHPLFRRRGEDLLVDVPITFREATLGSDIEVPTLGGTTAIRIPPGTRDGQVFRLSGRGLPKPSGGIRGDLHLEVHVEVPTQLQDADAARLSAFFDALDESQHPKRQTYERAMRARE